MPISVKFKFNKAGQGAFYTGFFKHHNRASHFSVAYDCGTSSSNKEYIKKEIWKFKTLLLKDHDNTLDLFMISHFDSDHVNQVKTLLEKLTHCHTIVLPYLYPEERLIIYLDHLARREEIDDDYVNFLINPVDFLIQFGNVGQIIFITGNDNDETGTAGNVNPDRPLIPEFRSERLDDDFPFKEDDREIKERSLPADLFPEMAFLTQNFTQVFICMDDCRYFITGIWYFYFFNKRNADKKMVAEFKNKVAKAFPKFKEIGTDINELRSLFQNKAELIKLYKQVFKEKNLNPISLVILHGPYTAWQVHGWSKGKIAHYAASHGHYHFRRELSANDTLLTGDLYLKGLTWPAFITGQYKRIAVIQIPHHGSSKNWDVSVLSSPALLHPVQAVINFGLGNTYNHPTAKVVTDVRNQGWRIRCAHELKSFNYSFLIK